MLMGIFAAAGDPGIPEPWNYILNYGILGALLLMIATGKFFVTRRELDAAAALAKSAKEEAAEASRKRDELNEKMADRIIPLLTDSTRVLTEVGRALQLTPTATKTATEKQLVEMVASLQDAIKELGQHDRTE